MVRVFSQALDLALSFDKRKVPPVKGVEERGPGHYLNKEVLGLDLRYEELAGRHPFIGPCTGKRILIGRKQLRAGVSLLIEVSDF